MMWLSQWQWHQPQQKARKLPLWKPPQTRTAALQLEVELEVEQELELELD